MSDNITCLVPLDALMDTRLATLRRLNEEQSVAIQGSWYHNRTVDTFDRNGSKINQRAFEALYEARDEETLKNAFMTQLPKYLMTLIARLTTQQGMPLLSQQFKIDINLYPYQLSEEVRASIVMAIETYTNNAAEVNLVDFAPEELTVQLIKSKYQILFMYDFNEWLMKHTEEFKQTTMPEVRVVAPRLYLKETPTALLAKVESEEYGWEQMSLMFVGLVGVVFMDVNLFSIVTDNEPDLDP
ncbi:hypothetical protein pEaSNUABM37_00159 [Erwinia phage pEa_SNUABM_37]|nr:hypothetical protein pEaSNUABM37_00159 [Erwinia phage pEa_SNUABM_37]QXO10629.1 hypothetical protein pEaSNUABM48_00159 [Erwinia phage pEa_SNUABM_48]